MLDLRFRIENSDALAELCLIISRLACSLLAEYVPRSCALTQCIVLCNAGSSDKKNSELQVSSLSSRTTSDWIFAGAKHLNVLVGHIFGE